LEALRGIFGPLIAGAQSHHEVRLVIRLVNRCYLSMKFCFGRDWSIRVVQVLILCCLQALTASSSLPEDKKLEVAKSLLTQREWRSIDLSSKPFPLRAYVSPNAFNAGILTIYIEGDGSAFGRGGYPSDDPTPKNPVGLYLALAQPNGAAVYLARPCQYFLASTECNSKTWTSGRFSQAVIESTNQAINILKEQTGSQKIVLVGYSGGAAIALLAAGHRRDTQAIVSVAGNLNPHLWAESLGLDPLVGSLDPRQAIPFLTTKTNIFFTGGKDVVLDAELTDGFMQLFPKDSRPTLIFIKENGHVCCWVEQWPLLWTQYIQNVAK
jgi:hypothetical protein